MAIVAVVLLIPALAILFPFSNAGDGPAISILPPLRQEPKLVPKEELVQHALEIINGDREKFGIPPVMLSENQAAQVHAEDVFTNKQISHWMSNGEKPYMTYTRYGGTGDISQNVAIAGFTKDQYEECINVIYECEKIDPITTLDELQFEMMYEDKECCDEGHRSNILNQYHTHVSIGIVYDQYYLAFVQNFENNYGVKVSASGGQAEILGQLSKGSIEYVAIQYDAIPDPAIYEQNKRLLSYSAGELVATVVKPLPLGYSYQEPEGYELIVADEWDISNNNQVSITFDLARSVSADGVYTIIAVVKDDATEETIQVTSYSVFIKSIRA